MFDDGGATLSGALNHDASYLLGFTCPGSQCPTVAPPTNCVPTNITNNGFETGNLTGWTTSGASTSVSSYTLPTTGSWSAQGGATSATNGDSNIAQTFTAPASSTILQFFYKSVCPDSVQYDWVTATLKRQHD